MKLTTILKLVNNCNMVQILDDTLSFIICDEPEEILKKIKEKKIPNEKVTMIESVSEVINTHSDDEITIIISKSGKGEEKNIK